jgi:hypothetical protein
MDLIEKNLNAQMRGGCLADILERDGAGVTIRYGYNSGGCERNVYFLTGDGGPLHIDTVIAEIAEVDFTDPSDPQWFLVGYEVNYEDPDLIDAHTGQKIPAAYL